MRAVLFFGWLVVPLVALAYHYGPGQERAAADRADHLLAKAHALAADQDPCGAIIAYEAALATIPVGETTTRQRARLEHAKAQMLCSQLPEAHESLGALVQELQDAVPAADAALLREARAAYASARFYLTWLMRLEGHPKEVWEPEIEGARQTYRLLAEEARAAGTSESGDTDLQDGYERDLAAAIRLARMDLGELEGLPLPSQ